MWLPCCLKLLFSNHIEIQNFQKISMFKLQFTFIVTNCLLFPTKICLTAVERILLSLITSSKYYMICLYYTIYQ